eukprot:jgi/Orpsp1_1/1192213/evm.model.d7180000091423.1
MMICANENENKNQNQSQNDTLIIWNLSLIDDMNSSLVYLDAFPLWYNKQKDNHQFQCLKIEYIGWNNHDVSTIIKENDVSSPDLILLDSDD